MRAAVERTASTKRIDGDGPPGLARLLGIGVQALTHTILQAVQPLFQLGRQGPLLRLQPLRKGVLRGRLLSCQLIEPAGQLPGTGIGSTPAERQECQRDSRRADRCPDRKILNFHRFLPSTRDAAKAALA